MSSYTKATPTSAPRRHTTLTVRAFRTPNVSSKRSGSNPIEVKASFAPVSE
nr:hypothetical protein [Methylobacterium durans]